MTFFDKAVPWIFCFLFLGTFAVILGKCRTAEIDLEKQRALCAPYAFVDTFRDGDAIMIMCRNASDTSGNTNGNTYDVKRYDGLPK